MEAYAKKDVSCSQACTYLILSRVQTQNSYNDMCSVPKCVLASGTGHIFLHKPPALFPSRKTIPGRSQPHNETEADRRLVSQLSGGVNENEGGREGDWQADTRWAAR